MVIQAGLLLVAVQLQPLPRVMFTWPRPPELAKERVVLSREATQLAGVAPAWVTVTARPAIIKLADRDEVAVLAATLYVTVPLPLLDAPEVTVNQLVSPLAAVQEQPEPIVTVTCPLPPELE